ncbi:MAG TPA: hypothetical protein VHP12_06725 [Chitinophagaceae bacterium]|nr:hypothetical protein [Chitinophagaceae bacterium]
MKIEKRVAQKIFKDLLLSIFIYALPILLMFAWFYTTKQKPWLNNQKQIQIKK